MSREHSTSARTGRSKHDLKGRRFGRLFVIRWSREVREKSGATLHYWRCACDCGIVKDVSQRKLLYAGGQKSCGCLCRDSMREVARTHGLSGLPEFRVWCKVRERCLSPTCKSFPDYGGRGIVICERWIASFPAFLSDMGERPSRLHSIERRRNDGPYSPENCYWATRVQQNRNTRRNRYLEYMGQRKTAAEWAVMFGIRAHCILKRISLGWSIERALETPARRSVGGKYVHSSPRLESPRTDEC